MGLLESVTSPLSTVDSDHAKWISSSELNDWTVDLHPLPKSVVELFIDHWSKPWGWTPSLDQLVLIPVERCRYQASIKARIQPHEKVSPGGQ